MSHVPHDAERALEDDLRAFFANGDVGFVRAALPSGTILQVNPAFCRIFDVDADLVVGRPLSDLPLSGEARGQFAERLAALSRGTADRFAGDVELSLQDNDIRWANLDVRAERGGNGRGDARLVGIARDVTAQVRSARECDVLRRRFAEQLEESQHQRDEIERTLDETVRRRHDFLAVLSHELRNPLAPIQNATRVARTPTATPDELQWSLAVIERQVGNMARLLDDLMDVSRIVRGRLQLQVERTSLNDAVASAVEVTRPLFDSKGHRFEVALPEETLWVEGDPLRLAQVVGNLLDNAASFTDRGGEISLRVSQEDTSYVIRVRDNGAGISPELLPHVFEMFVQAGRPGRSAGGLGIGLALVDGLVKLHHGSVSVHSDGAGQGSEFTVKLPVPVPTQVNWTGAMSHPAEGRPTALRILVADDNIDAAESLAVLLRLQGHEVRVAHDGLAAVREAEIFRPEVALVDIGMPIMNGHDVARWIRAQPWGGNLLVIALTGWNQPMDRVQTSLSGFDKHLAKPVSIGELTACFGARRDSQVET